MKLYKFTNQDLTTHNNTLWGEGVTHEVIKRKNYELCADDVLHAYADLNLAFLFNPLHLDIIYPRVFECEGEVVLTDWDKVGCQTLTTVKEIKPPSWVRSKNDKKVRVQFAVLCGREVLPIFEKEYPNDARPRLAIEAAEKWLAKPTKKNADAAYAASNAASAAAYDADFAAAYAAYAASNAASAAAYAAAFAAAYAASHAFYSKPSIDFAALAEQAVTMINK